MLCPLCKEEIADGAIKCKHCQSMLSSEAPASAVGSTGPVNSDNAFPLDEGYAKIEALKVEPAIKEKLKLVHANIKGTKFGLPDYGSLKGSALWQTFNLWAFFFNILYYLFKGMWRKALVLFGMYVGLQILDYMFVPRGYNGLALTLIGLFIGIIAMQSAYHDLYRKYVLGEEFWW